MTVFSLGGTIASVESSDATGGVTPALDAGDLLAGIGDVEQVAQVRARPFRQTSSGDLTMADAVALADAIRAERAAGTAGAVVTQGTDTIEEVAFALDLLLEPGPPVVVTGAMRNPTLPGADGPANLLSAVQVAAAPQSAGLGVLVVLAEQIHAARFVRKTHTSSPAAFRSEGAGPLGWVCEGAPHLGLAPTWPMPTLQVPGDRTPMVALTTMCLGDDGRLLAGLPGAGYEGLVVEGFGGGHVPGRLVATLDELAGRIPVVLASRTGAGEVLQQTYGFPGSERDLLARGLIAAGFLDGLKARILLMLLLAQGCDIAATREIFARFSTR